MRRHLSHRSFPGAERLAQVWGRSLLPSERKVTLALIVGLGRGAPGGSARGMAQDITRVTEMTLTVHPAEGSVRARCGGLWPGSLLGCLCISGPTSTLRVPSWSPGTLFKGTLTGGSAERKQRTCEPFCVSSALGQHLVVFSYPMCPRCTLCPSLHQPSTSEKVTFIRRLGTTCLEAPMLPERFQRVTQVGSASTRAQHAPAALPPPHSWKQSWGPWTPGPWGHSPIILCVPRARPRGQARLGVLSLWLHWPSPYSPFKTQPPEPTASIDNPGPEAEPLDASTPPYTKDPLSHDAVLSIAASAGWNSARMQQEPSLIHLCSLCVRHPAQPSSGRRLAPTSSKEDAIHNYHTQGKK